MIVLGEPLNLKELCEPVKENENILSGKQVRALDPGITLYFLVKCLQIAHFTHATPLRYVSNFRPQHLGPPLDQILDPHQGKQIMMMSQEGFLTILLSILIGQTLVMSSFYETPIGDVITLYFLVLKCLHQFSCSSYQKHLLINLLFPFLFLYLFLSSLFLFLCLFFSSLFLVCSPGSPSTIIVSTNVRYLAEIRISQIYLKNTKFYFLTRMPQWGGASGRAPPNHKYDHLFTINAILLLLSESFAVQIKILLACSKYVCSCRGKIIANFFAMQDDKPWAKLHTHKPLMCGSLLFGMKF